MFLDNHMNMLQKPSELLIMVLGMISCIAKLIQLYLMTFISISIYFLQNTTHSRLLGSRTEGRRPAERQKENSRKKINYGQ